MIISTNQGGLSNRIKSYVSCLRLDNDAKIKWDVLDSYKTKNHILNCCFDKLFKNEIEVKKIFKEDYTYNSHCLLILDSDNLPINFNTFNSNCSVSFSKSDKLNRNIDFMFNKIGDKLKEEYINHFKILKPIDKLQKKIDEFSKNFNNTISVHIRSWNRNAEQSRRNYLFNVKKFEKKMSEFDSKYKFYLASDSSDVLQYFNTKSQFKDRILIFPRQTLLDTSRDFYEGVQEDLIELYLLSKNNIIIGSHFSTYTEVAWWLGGCTENIFIL